MRINEVSKLTGLPISTLRFYERKQLIPGSYMYRDIHNYRVYSEEIVEYLNDVKALLSADFSIEELSLLVNDEINLSYEDKLKLVKQKVKEINDLKNQLNRSEQYLKTILEGTAKFHKEC
ncbi:MerR family transcriptional regulator [Paenibacillus urinalis]|uniref:MerR family transcriptional regulator n=1 Tax=Paenibacillus urinalis TaxID=521520 RepID=A0AAX3MV44_9BACL|nr:MULTISPECIES: MerR family transcriptional regulator [Paenibacillus]WDH80674.1 MerR family transcriptional regulator [Paenibacillus urinalis]WDH96726.1 MerR family transcriptional regulator [Paenibacillus urinalis]WDI00370.1 MerR family transcriptional regulator [Paenibacillus urinalis]GAK40884.1 MerR family transcriptional regulator [Paenibacillus sp. TCA20]